MKIRYKVYKGPFRTASQPLQFQYLFLRRDLKKIGHRFFWIYPTDMQFKTFDWNTAGLHFLGEAQPVLRFGAYRRFGHLGADPFLAYKQTFIYQFVKRLAQGGPRN